MPPIDLPLMKTNVKMDARQEFLAKQNPRLVMSENLDYLLQSENEIKK